MGKRSDFKRRPMDDYETPPSAVQPLIPHLTGIRKFAEPCAGRGHLIRHLEAAGLECVFACELSTRMVPLTETIIESGIDALACGRECFADADAIISNPPWSRWLLHPLIWHFATIMPTWLLFDADWVHTKQSAALIRHCSHIVSVGRVKWIAKSRHTGKDNAAWHRFDRLHTAGPIFIGREERRVAA